MTSKQKELVEFLDNSSVINIFTLMSGKVKDSMECIFSNHYFTLFSKTYIAGKGYSSVMRTKNTRCHAIAGRTAWCLCKFWYVSNFTTPSCGFYATAWVSCKFLHQWPFKCWNCTQFADFHSCDAAKPKITAHDQNQKVAQTSLWS